MFAPRSLVILAVSSIAGSALAQSGSASLRGFMEGLGGSLPLGISQQDPGDPFAFRLVDDPRLFVFNSTGSVVSFGFLDPQSGYQALGGMLIDPEDNAGDVVATFSGVMAHPWHTPFEVVYTAESDQWIDSLDIMAEVFNVQSSGIDVSVLVRGDSIFGPALSNGQSVSVSLSEGQNDMLLEAGDQIIVSINAGDNTFFDWTNVSFEIAYTSVPAPATGALALGGLLGVSRRRR